MRDDVSRGHTIRHTGWVGLIFSGGAKRVRAIGNPLNDLGYAWLDTRTQGHVVVVKRDVDGRGFGVNVGLRD